MKKIKNLGTRMPTTGAKHRQSWGLFECDCCGQIVERRIGSGRLKSCGCEQNKKPIKHGYAKKDKNDSLYKRWMSMRDRCSNSKRREWPRYGGRGIKICEEWNDYIIFRKWAMTNGYEPHLEIDRIDNDGNYEPLNCRFVTRQQNQVNRTPAPGISGYKGVTRNWKKWKATIKINGYHKYIGTYEYAIDAALAYDFAARKYFGKYAILNNPNMG